MLTENVTTTSQISEVSSMFKTRKELFTTAFDAAIQCTQTYKSKINDCITTNETLQKNLLSLQKSFQYLETYRVQAGVKQKYFEDYYVFSEKARFAYQTSSKSRMHILGSHSSRSGKTIETIKDLKYLLNRDLTNTLSATITDSRLKIARYYMEMLKSASNFYSMMNPLAFYERARDLIIFKVPLPRHSYPEKSLDAGKPFWHMWDPATKPETFLSDHAVLALTQILTEFCDPLIAEIERHDVVIAESLDQLTVLIEKTRGDYEMAVYQTQIVPSFIT